ncbi:AAA family ATPase [uncultured Faecalibaculum sp.]|uniref:AAA family ATPase n=1 Tax=uncultured Faecalibaculum sp. TaxID=1729681 RepID=UPI00272E6055|nr:AAA family ATPase [uncultured Faecalibaculum sp.]
MFEKLSQIRTKGGPFTNPTYMQLFSKPREHLCLIYGRNGSGKTTISRGFSYIKNPNSFTTIQNCSLLDNSGNEIISPNLPNRVFVFNEDYIRDNIQISEQGLGTIVMFGLQGDLQGQINEKQSTLDDLNDRLNKVNSKLELHQDRRSAQSHLYFEEKIQTELRGDGNWAGRERQIRGTKTNVSVNKSVIEKLVKHRPAAEKKECFNDFQHKLKQYSQIRNESSHITADFSHIGYPVVQIKRIKSLLLKKIENPELTEREEYLLSLTPHENQKLYQIFADESQISCPVCLRPLSTDDKNHVIDVITNILNNELDIHLQNLQKTSLSVTASAPENCKQFTKEYIAVSDACVEINKQITYINNLIEQKSNNPYNPIEFDDQMLYKAISSYNKSIDVLSSRVAEYNLAVSDKLGMQKELTELNAFCGYYEIIGDYETYTQLKSLYDEYLSQHSELTKQIATCNNELLALQSRMKNTNIAVESINKDLCMALYDKDRLSLIDKGGVYHLQSQGFEVTPTQISTGERNIIALSYFFASIRDQTPVTTPYSDEVLIVIDDPISSFDRDNRIGITSLLQTKLEEVRKGNQNSRIIILTHDYETFFDLEKVCKMISQGTKDLNKCILDKLSLSTYDNKTPSVYTNLLHMVFEYAKSKPDELSLTIGNTMRRVLEAFSTFLYRKGVQEITRDEYILNLIDNISIRQYFRSKMFRLLLHGESHFEEQAKALNDMEFYERFSDLTKQSLAQDLLVFLYLIQPAHLLAHLREEEDVESHLQSWEQQITTIVNDKAV